MLLLFLKWCICYEFDVGVLWFVWWRLCGLLSVRVLSCSLVLVVVVVCVCVVVWVVCVVVGLRFVSSVSLCSLWFVFGFVSVVVFLVFGLWLPLLVSVCSCCDIRLCCCWLRLLLCVCLLSLISVLF